MAPRTEENLSPSTATLRQRMRIESEIALMPSQSAELNPNQPVDVLCATALRLASLGRPERARLEALAAFDLWHFERLVDTVSVLSDYEANWNKLRAKSRAGVSTRVIKEANELKRDVFESARFLLRHDPEVQQALDQIGEGTGVADLAVDLRNLYSLYSAFPEIFATDDTLSPERFARMPVLANTISVGIDPGEAALAQAQRNRAFWYLLESVNELRSALRFLWRKSPTKLTTLGISYASQLRRGARARSKKTVTGSGGPAPKAE